MQRTYWHLERARQKPSDYDIATSRLLYYVNRGFEVRTPLGEWYARYQRASPLRLHDWDRFRDPRETTYGKYTELQRDKEVFVDGLFAWMSAIAYDRHLDPSWVQRLNRTLAPLRYPMHALQMVASYVGSMAPGGRVVIACALQAADEMRRVQRLAYRVRQLQAIDADFGRDSRALWECDLMWQPLRELIERLLVTYDFGAALFALNGAVKPILDEFFMVHLGAVAHRFGDEALQKIFLSLHEDCAWHREWFRAFVHVALEDEPDNARVVATWLDEWRPRVWAAIQPFAEIFDGGEPTFASAQREIAALLESYPAPLRAAA